MPIDDALEATSHPTFQHARGSTRVRELLVVGESAGRRFVLPSAGSLTVGRSERCDLVLDDPSVSRHHAVIEVGRVVRIRDNGSVNGVIVKRRVLGRDESCEISPGDMVELGGVTLVLHDRPPVEPATPTRGADGRREREGRPVVVADESIRKLHDLVATFATSTIGILLLGETGVGKDVFAESIHRRSKRAQAPFLRLNCAALSPTLLESELFGHERGAFTGAQQHKVGLLESADRGTVFLDEVGELPLAMQAKLLRVLEDREVRRVGALQARSVDIRFVAATNRDLRAEIAKGNFREDLFFRLSGVVLRIPPLRERPSEIAPLARMFAQQSARLVDDRAEPECTAEFIDRLCAYGWPGNVRELRHVIERAVLLASDGVLRPEHLPTEFDPESVRHVSALPGIADTGRSTLRASEIGTRRLPGTKPSDGETAIVSRSRLRSELADIERARIVEALARCDGNQTRAAELLGMPRRTFVLRLREYQIVRKRSFE